ncbi:MOXD1 2-like, partial [Vespula maculifrons]
MPVPYYRPFILAGGKAFRPKDLPRPPAAPTRLLAGSPLESFDLGRALISILNYPIQIKDSKLFHRTPYRADNDRPRSEILAASAARVENEATSWIASGQCSNQIQSFPINDTMQVVWQYHAKEPASVAGVLPGHGAVRGSRPLYLVQRDTQPKRSSHNQESEPVLKTWDVLNQQLESLKSEQDVSWEIDAASLFQWIRRERELLSNAFETFDTTLKSSVYWLRQLFYFSKLSTSEEFSRVILPRDKDSLLWCRVIKMPNINRKHHVVKYEPVIEPGKNTYLHHMTLYECPINNLQLEEASKTTGSICYKDDNATQCNTIAATWSLGSEGFNYPPEAGYALDPDNGSRYYMLETQYINPQQLVNDNLVVSDSSGLRLYYTDQLRLHDAGILSIGIDPNWRHIIPPGQPEVVSEGHCIAECTGQTIPNSGINMFAVIMHTHQLGRKIRFRQIRAGEELPPIASDTNYDPTYQEYRKLQRPVKVYPGDHLVAECTYSSESRSTITLGGLMTRQETCLVSALYYPRIELSICYSLPSLPTVLQSLGVQKVIQDSTLVKIQEPKSLSGMTLEDRLISYDWETSFQSFQEATRVGTFMPLCWTSKGVLQGTESLVAHYPRILYSYEESNLACSDMGYPMDAESDEANAVERGQLVRSKVSRSSEGPTAASPPSISGPYSLPLILGTTLLVGLAVGL